MLYLSSRQTGEQQQLSEFQAYYRQPIESTNRPNIQIGCYVNESGDIVIAPSRTTVAITFRFNPEILIGRFHSDYLPFHEPKNDLATHGVPQQYNLFPRYRMRRFNKILFVSVLCILTGVNLQFREVAVCKNPLVVEIQ